MRAYVNLFLMLVCYLFAKIVGQSLHRTAIMIGQILNDFALFHQQNTRRNVGHKVKIMAR